jgi:hypothetical protein
MKSKEENDFVEQKKEMPIFSPEVKKPSEDVRKSMLADDTKKSDSRCCNVF